MKRIREQLNGNLKWIMGIIGSVFVIALTAFGSYTIGGAQTASLNKASLETVCKKVDTIEKRNIQKDKQWVLLEYYLEQMAAKMDIDPPPRDR